MAGDFVPFIEHEHYQTMRVLATDLPETYAEWHSEFYERELAKLRKLGRHPQPVTVSPVAFNGYLTREKREGSMQELLRCAITTAKENVLDTTIGDHD